MKKGWTIFWIVCGSLAGLGLVLCMASLALGVTTDQIRLRIGDGIGIHTHGFFKFADEEDPDGQDFDRDLRETYSGVENIEAFVYAGKVKILPGDVDEVTVETSRINQELHLKIDQDGDCLTLDTDDDVWGVNSGGEEGEICIYIPRGQSLGTIDFELDAGTLHIEDICAGELKVDAGAGEASLQNIQVSAADIDCGVGSVTGNGCISSELDADVGVGSLEFTLAGTETDYDYAISVGVGEVKCGGSRYSGLGFAKEIDNHAGRTVEIDCGAGSAAVSFDGTAHHDWGAGHHQEWRNGAHHAE